MGERFVRYRTERQARKWQRRLERYRVIQKQIREEAPDILRSKNFNHMKRHIQHGNVSVNAHVMNVARYSIAISERLHIACSKRDLIRGALLHDYFLYDWHIPDKENPHRLHGFYHPGVALRNASKEYELIVTTADKWCSFMETLHMLRGHGIVLQRHDDEEYIGDGRNWSTYSNS